MKPTLRLLFWLCLVAALAWQALAPESSLTRWLAGVLHPQTAVEQALAARVWRHGLNWAELDDAQQADQRGAVLQALDDLQRIRTARLSSGQEPSVGHTAHDEIARFQKMLGFQTARYEHALNHGLLTEAVFTQSVRDQLLDERWLVTRTFSAQRDEDVQTWYQSHRSALTVPQAYHAAHRFLSGHEPGNPDRQAEMQYRAQQSIAIGSEDERTRHRDGDLGWFTAARMPADFMASVQGLSVGETSPIVRTQLGWHIITLLDVRPARGAKLDEVKDEIVAMLEQERRELAVRGIMQQLRQGLALAEPGLPIK